MVGALFSAMLCGGRDDRAALGSATLGSGPEALAQGGGTTEYTEAHGRNDVGRGDPTGSAQSVYSVYSVVQIVKRACATALQV